MYDTFKAVTDNPDAVNVAYDRIYFVIVVTQKRDTPVVRTGFVIAPTR
jgi:hypothetical protein